jgi:putative endonuclease
MLSKEYYVYFLTNWNNKVLYVGVTNDLKRRVYEHQNGLNQGFTQRYHVNKLVCYEIYEEIEEAILREKRVKGGARKKKNDIVTNFNPGWEDLSYKI